MSEPYYRVPIDLTHPGRRAISRGVGTAAGAAGAEADGQPSSTPTGPVSQRQFIILAPAMAVTLVLLSPARLVVGYTLFAEALAPASRNGTMFARQHLMEAWPCLKRSNQTLPHHHDSPTQNYPDQP